MKSENAIEVNNITKSFKVYLDKGHTLKEKTLFSKRRKYEERKVLDGISFEVKKGEAIGLIGHNGCGKSTTLKLLTKIMYPDSGTIEMKGRVSSLIELGAGFHPDMSGRENIYTNASIFGLTKKEIDKRVDDIIAFSELEEFIDNPVRTYSSGMYMRLAFSVAINVDADILLIDEILAVGDANFQAKCFDKLHKIKANGTTIVLVSHSLGQIEQICERTLWIDQGKIREEGTPREVHPIYLDYMGQKRQAIVEKESERENVKKAENILNSSEGQENRKRRGNGKVRFGEVQLYDSNGQPGKVFETGSDILVEMNYKVRERVEDIVVGIVICQNDGTCCYGTNTRMDYLNRIHLDHDGKMEVYLKNVLLLPGTYKIDLTIESETGLPIDYYKEAAIFDIHSKETGFGIMSIKHKWQIE